MQTEYNEFIAAIETATTAYLEYETKHEDAGANYLFCVPDGMQYNNATDRLQSWLALHNITLLPGAADELLDYCAQMDLIEPNRGSIWGPYDSKPFYMDNEHHHNTPDFFTCDDYPIGEVEAQIELSSLTSSPFAKAFARKAVDDNRVCVHYRDGDDSLLSYQITDECWFFLISIADVRDWLLEQVDQGSAVYVHAA